MFNKFIFYGFSFLSFLLATQLSAQQAWAPYERQLWVRPVFVHSRYDSAYLANNFAKYDDDVRINVASLSLEYGITDRLTADLTVGNGRLSRHRLVDRYYGLTQIPETKDKNGILDSRIGLRYKITDEFDSKYSWMPTLSLRLGGIKKGDYDRHPQALGDGANGVEANLYFAKDFNFWGLGTLGELSYRRREQPVPDDILYYGALYKRIASFIITLGGRGQFGQGGYDFADPRHRPPYNNYNIVIPDQYPGVNLYDMWVRDQRPAWGRKENFHNVEVGFGFPDSYGNFYTIFYSQTYWGYNTPKLQTIGIAANLPFNL